MNIIFNGEVAEALCSTHTLLELDTFDDINSVKPRTAYCVLDTKRLNTEDLFNLDKLATMHDALIRNYKNKNYDFCIDVLDILKGKWGGQLDSFYDVLRARINGETLDLRNQ